jgi:hypothetical protein
LLLDNAAALVAPFPEPGFVDNAQQDSFNVGAEDPVA